MSLHPTQVLIVLSVICALSVLTALHDIAGSIAAPIFTAALAGTLGYASGRAVR